MFPGGADLFWSCQILTIRQAGEGGKSDWEQPLTGYWKSFAGPIMSSRSGPVGVVWSGRAVNEDGVRRRGLGDGFTLLAEVGSVWIECKTGASA